MLISYNGKLLNYNGKLLSYTPSIPAPEPDFNLSGYSYNGNQVDVGSSLGLFFKSDGTKMYVSSNTSIKEYSLSTAWDVTSLNLTYEISLEHISTTIMDATFSYDGTLLFAPTRSDIHKYSLSTAWDVSTVSYIETINIGFIVPSTYYGFIQDICFTNDGMKCYLGLNGFLDYGDNIVAQVDLNTAFDLNDIYTTYYYNLGYTRPVSSLFFKSDGTKYLAVDSGTNNTIKEYNMTTPFTIETSVKQSNELYQTDIIIYDIYVGPTKLYTLTSAGLLKEYQK